MGRNKRALPPSKVAEIAHLFTRGWTHKSIATAVGCHPANVSKVLKRLKEAEDEPDLDWVIPDQPVRRKLKPCGTEAAYRRHLRKGERCYICAGAHAEENKRWPRKRAKSAGNQSK